MTGVMYYYLLLIYYQTKSQQIQITFIINFTRMVKLKTGNIDTII